MTTKPTPQPSRLDPEPMPRRDLLGIMSLWSAAAALVFSALGMLRLPKAAVLPTPSRRFRVSLPESLAPGEAFMPPGRSVAVFRDSDGVWAISTICTHLGCVVKHDASGFECPCHGSRFDVDGTTIKGPAPQPLPWIKVSPSGDTYVVDEAEMVPPGTKVQA